MADAACGSRHGTVMHGMASIALVVRMVGLVPAASPQPKLVLLHDLDLRWRTRVNCADA